MEKIELASNQLDTNEIDSKDNDNTIVQQIIDANDGKNTKQEVINDNRDLERNDDNLDEYDDESNELEQQQQPKPKPLTLEEKKERLRLINRVRKYKNSSFKNAIAHLGNDEQLELMSNMEIADLVSEMGTIVNITNQNIAQRQTFSVVSNLSEKAFISLGYKCAGMGNALNTESNNRLWEEILLNRDLSISSPEVMLLMSVYLTASTLDQINELKEKAQSKIKAKISDDLAKKVDNI